VPGTGGAKVGSLKCGTHLRTPGGSDAAVVADDWIPPQRDGWMWDLTIPRGNDHDFYVDIEAADVLVHNCGQGDLNYNQIRNCTATHTSPLHGFGTPAEGTKFASVIGEDEIFKGLVERVSENNETGMVDSVTGNHEHIISWLGAGSNGENLVRVWMTPNGGLGGMWPITGTE
jgi:hypothetical protein